MSDVKKESKAATVESMRRMIAAQNGAVVAEHKGLTVAEVTSLRRKLRDVGAEIRVVKNTLIRLAARDTAFAQLDGTFRGPTAIAFASADPVAMAKALKEYAGANPKFRLKAGFLDGKILTGREVEALADVPPREVLLARLVGQLASPMARLAQVLSGPARKMAYALNSIHEQKSRQATA